MYTIDLKNEVKRESGYLSDMALIILKVY